MGIFKKKKEKEEKIVAPVKESKVKSEPKKAESAKKPSMKDLYGGEQEISETKTGKTVKIQKPKKAEPAKKSSMKDLYGGEQEISKTKTGKTVKIQRKYRNAYRVLIKPLITEKATKMAAENKYVFEVERTANKIEIAKAIKEVYGVKPVAVNVMSKRGKNVRFGRTIGKRKAWKKAIITLPTGKSINIYEGV